MKTEVRLTAREQEIFDYFVKTGSSNKHIARYLRLSESTVKFHMKHILEKFGVNTRTQLLAYAKI